MVCIVSTVAILLMKFGSVQRYRSVFACDSTQLLIAEIAIVLILLHDHWILTDHLRLPAPAIPAISPVVNTHAVHGLTLIPRPQG